MTKQLTDLSTSDLFEATNAALINGHLPEARVGLDELARRDDLVDRLCAPSAYRLPSGDYGRIFKGWSTARRTATLTSARRCGHEVHARQAPGASGGLGAPRGRQRLHPVPP